MADATVDKSTWLVELPDGSREWRERINGGYSVVKTESAPVTTDSEGNVTQDNVQIKNLNIKSNLFVDGDNGVNKEITVGGLHMVVKEGIITTLEEV